MEELEVIYPMYTDANHTDYFMFHRRNTQADLTENF
jgi:hypothetical protein